MVQTNANIGSVKMGKRGVKHLNGVPKLVCANCDFLIKYTGKLQLTSDLYSQCNNQKSLNYGRILLIKESCSWHSKKKKVTHETN